MTYNCDIKIRKFKLKDMSFHKLQTNKINV